MKVVLGGDHGGASLKKELSEYLRLNNVEAMEIGACDSSETCDYPDVAKEVAKIVNAQGIFGVLVCGTGIGISIAANKISGIRCALVHDAYTARMAREHNDANVVAFGGRVTGSEVAKDALWKFLNTNFQGGRHQTRVDKIES